MGVVPSHSIPPTEAGCLNRGPDKGFDSSALARVRRVNTLKMEQYIMAPTTAAGNMQTEPNRERERGGEKGETSERINIPETNELRAPNTVKPRRCLCFLLQMIFLHHRVKY